jgi:hypothetical protein
MSNPSRAKGTAFEVEVLDHLRAIFGPTVERAPLKGVYDKGDYLNVPFLIDAKKTERPLFLEWARQARRKADGSYWAYIYADDRRKASSAGTLALLPMDFFMALLWSAQQAGLFDG